MEFNNIKFIKNVLKGSQIKHVTINKDDAIILIILKNNIVIIINFEKSYTYCNCYTIEHQNCHIEILKNDEYMEDWEVFLEREANEINSILFDYSINM